MDRIRRQDLPETDCLGRTIWRAIGANAPLADNVSGGFARFSKEHGIMKLHKHERELIYVLDARGASAQFGFDRSVMDTAELHAGDLLRFHAEEWHVFNLEDDAAYLDIFWMFDVPQNHTVDAD